MKKLYIILTILVILFVFTVSMVVYYKFIDKNVNNTLDENKIISEDRLKELFDNSYMYFLLKDGKIKKIKTALINDKEYLMVDKIHSLEDIDKIVNNTFDSSRKDALLELLYNTRKFIEVENQVYVSYDDSCDAMDVKYEEIKQEKENDTTVRLRTDDLSILAIYENDNWYLQSPFHICKSILE